MRAKPICCLTVLSHIQPASKSCQLCFWPNSLNVLTSATAVDQVTTVSCLGTTAVSWLASCIHSCPCSLFSRSGQRDPFTMDHFTLLLKTFPCLSVTRKIRSRFLTKVYKTIWSFPGYLSASFSITPSFACPPLSSHIGFLAGLKQPL